MTARSALGLLAALLAISGGILTVWDAGRPMLYGMLLGAAAGIAVIALLAGRPAPDVAREISDESVAAMIAAIGALLILLGVAVGLWLVLIGGGVLVAGLAGVARELRAGGDAAP